MVLINSLNSLHEVTINLPDFKDNINYIPLSVTELIINAPIYNKYSKTKMDYLPHSINKLYLYIIQLHNNYCKYDRLPPNITYFHIEIEKNRRHININTNPYINLPLLIKYAHIKLHSYTTIANLPNLITSLGLYVDISLNNNNTNNYDNISIFNKLTCITFYNTCNINLIIDKLINIIGVHIYINFHSEIENDLDSNDNNSADIDKYYINILNNLNKLSNIQILHINEKCTFIRKINKVKNECITNPYKIPSNLHIINNLNNLSKISIIIFNEDFIATHSYGINNQYYQHDLKNDNDDQDHQHDLCSNNDQDDSDNDQDDSDNDQDDSDNDQDNSDDDQYYNGKINKFYRYKLNFNFTKYKNLKQIYVLNIHSANHIDSLKYLTNKQNKNIIIKYKICKCISMFKMLSSYDDYIDTHWDDPYCNLSSTSEYISYSFNTLFILESYL